MDKILNLNIPGLYAIWENNGENVYLSNDLKLFLKLHENIVDPYCFIKETRTRFGDFLLTALKKIDASDYIKDFSENNLRLSYDENEQIFVFSVLKQDNDSLKKADCKNEYESMLDYLPICVWRKNRDLRLNYCNQKYADIVGTTKDKVIMDNIRLISKTTRNSVYVDQNLYAHKPKQIEEHIMVGDERRLFSITELPFNGGEEAHGFAIDITDLEIVRKIFNKYKEQAEQIFDELAAPIAIFDSNTNLNFINQSAINLFELEKLDLKTNCKFLDILDHIITNESVFSIEDAKRYKNKIDDIFKTLIGSYSTTINLKNGMIMNLIISACPSGTVSFVFENISDKVALKREVNSLETIQNHTIEHLSEGIVVFGTDNRIKVINEATYTMFLFDKEKNFVGEHLGDFLRSVLKVEGNQSSDALTNRIIECAEQRVGYETSIISDSNEITLNYIPLPEGLHLLKFKDLSEVKHLKLELDRQIAITSHIDTIKQKIISVIAKEFNAPLNTVNTFVEVLKSDYIGAFTEQQKQYFQLIVSNLDKITDLVLATTTLADNEFMKSRQDLFNAKEMVEEICNDLQDRSKMYGIDILSNVDDQINIFGNRSLISRAIKHIVNMIMFDASCVKTIDICCNDAGNFGGYYIIEISSDGKLIDSEKLLQLESMLLKDESNNESYFSDSQILAANKIVRLHNGKVFAKIVDFKNVFEIQLPK